ncbi:MAG: 30S ribosome-binding factor RbfA [Candidatus Kerfeldbacteria bacterium]
MPSHRIKQVNELIQHELGKILSKEIGLPPDSLVTITRVKTSSDLSQARVLVSIMPANKRASILAILNKNIKSIQNEFNQVVILRKTPKLAFSIDIDQQKISHIDGLIDKIHREE